MLADVARHLEHIDAGHREHLLQSRIRLDDAALRQLVPMRRILFVILTNSSHQVSSRGHPFERFPDPTLWKVRSVLSRLHVNVCDQALLGKLLPRSTNAIFFSCPQCLNYMILYEMLEKLYLKLIEHVVKLSADKYFEELIRQFLNLGRRTACRQHLSLVLLDVLPDLLGHLGARQRRLAADRRQPKMLSKFIRHLNNSVRHASTLSSSYFDLDL